MSKDKPAIAPVVSTRLRDYKLAKRYQGLLERFDKLQKYMESAGKHPPCLRLARMDYADIDASVRQQSQGRFTLADIQHREVPILSAAE